jgi:hypothetical protein
VLSFEFQFRSERRPEEAPPDAVQIGDELDAALFAFAGTSLASFLYRLELKTQISSKARVGAPYTDEERRYLEGCQAR